MIRNNGLLPATMPELTDWRDAAACANVEPDLFFEENDLNVETAKSICRDCPVAAACLETSMVNREEFGIWGGMLPEERDRMRRTWLRRRGESETRSTVRTRSGMLTRNPALDRRFDARLKAAQECRIRLAKMTDVPRQDEYLAVIELLIAHPSEGAGKLARRLGRSTSWFNWMKTRAYDIVGIKEIILHPGEEVA